MIGPVVCGAEMFTSPDRRLDTVFGPWWGDTDLVALPPFPSEFVLDCPRQAEEKSFNFGCEGLRSGYTLNKLPPIQSHRSTFEKTVETLGPLKTYSRGEICNLR